MYSPKARDRIRKMERELGLYRGRPVNPIILTSDDFEPTNPSFYIEWDSQEKQFKMSE